MPPTSSVTCRCRSIAVRTASVRTGKLETPARTKTPAARAEASSAPIPATRRILDRTGLRIDDIDLFEINEAFAPVVLGWQRELGVDPGRVNVNGGAIALGHPLGASGARLTATLVHEMRRSGARRGLQTMCEGGGLANATILESLA